MPLLYDHRGRPIDMEQLTEEIATTSLVGVRTVWHDSVAFRLTPERLASILRAVDQNDILEYLTLAEEMEERDLHYHSVLSTRKLAVGGLNVVVESATDDPKDVEIADFVREVAESEEAGDLVDDLLDALGKGYSVSEIMWNREGPRWMPSHYCWRDPRYFQFDMVTGRELRLRDEKDPVNGLSLAPYKFIQHRPRLKTGLPIRGGLARLAVVAYMCKSYSLKDWMAFCEVFGMPLRLGKYQLGATPEQKAELLRAVANLGTDAAAIIPDGMVIELIEASKGQGGEKLFEGLAEWLDRQVSKGVLGQTASTEGTPGKLGADDAQENVRSDLRTSDAKQLQNTLRRDLVRPLVDLNFGPQPRNRYPKLRLAAEDPEDLKLLSESLPPFITMGLRVEESVIRDKFGLPEPEEGAVLLKAPAPSSPFGFSPAGGFNSPPTGSEGVKGEADVPPAPDQLRRVYEETAVAILRSIRDGNDLTPAQSAFLATLSAGSDDEIGRIGAEALGGWKRVMDPILKPIMDLAGRAKSADDFLKGLDDLKLDTTALQEAIAVLTFKGRALGASTTGG